MFVDLERIAVPDDDHRNIIYVRRKMDMQTRARVLDDVAAAGGRGASLGTLQLAMLRHNVLAWEGPDFCDAAGRPIPCTPEQIGRMDPDAPLVTKALNRLGELNPTRTSPDPKSRTASGLSAAGGPNSPASTADLSASTTATSSSPSGSAG